MILRRHKKNNEPEKLIEVEVKSETKTDYSKMEYKDIKSLASTKGINTHGMKKQELIEVLTALEG